MKQIRLRRLDDDQRALLVNAAGAAGGKAAQKMWRMLEQERDILRGKRERQADDESEIPRSQAEFERMMKDEG